MRVLCLSSVNSWIFDRFFVNFVHYVLILPYGVEINHLKMVSQQQFRLKWNNHRNTVLQEFGNLLNKNFFVDCIVGAEGKYLNAHKIVLSACSPYFQVSIFCTKFIIKCDQWLKIDLKSTSHSSTFHPLARLMNYFRYHCTGL